MGQAMGLRTAVASGSAEAIRGVLTTCFALAEPQLTQAVHTLAPDAR
mgnify:FL=1